jgi:predicted amidohydrolase YtcJ
LADVIVKASRIHSLTDERATFASLAIRDGWIVAASAEPDGLDGLGGPGTRTVDASGLTLLPAFFDTHEHLLDSARDLARVRLEGARSLAEVVALIRERAVRTPAGQWIQTSAGWNESSLAETRLPTADELDSATTDHPVLVPRGGHVCVTNTAGLRLFGVGADTPDPPGGTIGRRANGSPNGVLEGRAASEIKGIIPPPPIAESVENLAQACKTYAALGVGSIREALILPRDWEVYQSAWEQGRLTLRCLPMLLVDSSEPHERRLGLIEGLGARSAFGDDWLRLWGLKLIADGGVAGAAMEEPFANNPSWSGHLNWDTDEMAEVVTLALAHNWKVATHAVGDRTVRTVLDVYERALAQHPDTPAAALTLEHAFLADETQRARAVRLGIAVTVQHALLYVNAAEIVASWGEERARRVMPVRSWLADGAILAAGTDTVRPFNPMLNIWGFVTRGTETAGVLGPEEAVDTYAAVDLCTAAAARLTGESDRRGTLQPRRLADIVAYETDPITAPVDRLPSLTPAFTLVGGRASHDPAGLFDALDRDADE